jgi:two-component system OmpR family sensor kinase
MEPKENLLLVTLERLLAIEAINVDSALNQAAQLVGDALKAEKIDIFIYQPTDHTLVSLGTNDTPLSRRQRELGLDRLPVANRGYMVEVYLTGIPFITGHADAEPGEIIGVTRPFPDGLGIRSEIIATIKVNGEIQGVLTAASSQQEFFSEQELHFLEATALWVGIIMHRAGGGGGETQAAREQGRSMAAEELVTVMAHDLHNYLTPIKARIDLIARRAHREKREPDIRDTTAASNALSNLDRLVGDLLDVARLEQGVFSINPQPTNLVNLIQELIHIFSTPERVIYLHAPKDIELAVDADRIRQALQNLLANAVKHAPRNTPVEIKVEASNQGNGARVNIMISNQGPGIPSDILPHLFQPFIAGTTSTGLGLGLYLANQIALVHGGSLNVETSPLQGVHFVLSLPIEKEYMD